MLGREHHALHHALEVQAEPQKRSRDENGMRVLLPPPLPLLANATSSATPSSCKTLRENFVGPVLSWLCIFSEKVNLLKSFVL